MHKELFQTFKISLLIVAIFLNIMGTQVGAMKGGEPPNQSTESQNQSSTRRIPATEGDPSTITDSLQHRDETAKVTIGEDTSISNEGSAQKPPPKRIATRVSTTQEGTSQRLLYNASSRNDDEDCCCLCSGTRPSCDRLCENGCCTYQCRRGCTRVLRNIKDCCCCPVRALSRCFRRSTPIWRWGGYLSMLATPVSAGLSAFDGSKAIYQQITFGCACATLLFKGLERCVGKYSYADYYHNYDSDLLQE